MARGPKVEKDRSERWLLTYSDLMNLLLILFIILFSMSNVDAKKAQAFAEALGKGFAGANASIKSTGSQKGGVSALLAVSRSSSDYSSGGADSVTDIQYNSLYRQILALVKKGGLTGKVSVQKNQSGVIISLSNNVLFASGRADLNQKSGGLVVAIGKIVSKVDYSQIIVQGHTDSDPIRNSSFRDNLDLSTARANNVNRLLTSKCGIVSAKISSMGYGSRRPIASNKTEAGKARNRRVVITILKPELAADEVVDAQAFSASAAASASKSAVSGSASYAPSTTSGGARRVSGASAAASGR